MAASISSSPSLLSLSSLWSEALRIDLDDNDPARAVEVYRKMLAVAGEEGAADGDEVATDGEDISSAGTSSQTSTDEKKTELLISANLNLSLCLKSSSPPSSLSHLQTAVSLSSSSGGSLRETDAVRFLGYDASEDTEGIFSPSDGGRRRFGEAVAALLHSFGYTQPAAGEFLSEVLPGPSRRSRIFAGESFFSRRSSFRLSPSSSPLRALVYLFLFGNSAPLSLVSSLLPPSSVALLLSSSLLVPSLASPSSPPSVVASVQIFPLTSTSFSPALPPRTALVCTDWPLESFRPPKNAVMPVGYDSMELVAVAAADPPSAGSEVLDICCGGGTQGIACGVFHRAEKLSLSLTFADVNPRALLLCAASLSLNFPPSYVASSTALLLSDAFSSLPPLSRFSLILCNPPFVAVPPDNETSRIPLHRQPSLYASGGADGNAVLRKVFAALPSRLLDSSSRLLMVTELPNVLSSPSLVVSMLPSNSGGGTVEVCYCVPDVETVGEYSEARRAEREEGVPAAVYGERIGGEVRVEDRALVLLRVTADAAAPRFTETLTAFSSWYYLAVFLDAASVAECRSWAREVAGPGDPASLEKLEGEHATLAFGGGGRGKIMGSEIEAVERLAVALLGSEATVAIAGLAGDVSGTAAAVSTVGERGDAIAALAGQKLHVTLSHSLATRAARSAELLASAPVTPTVGRTLTGRVGVCVRRASGERETIFDKERAVGEQLFGAVRGGEEEGEEEEEEEEDRFLTPGGIEFLQHHLGRRER